MFGWMVESNKINYYNLFIEIILILRYEGEWMNNNMHGKGVYTWKE
jgi:hypothetical protein